MDETCPSLARRCLLVQQEHLIRKYEWKQEGRFNYGWFSISGSFLIVLPAQTQTSLSGEYGLIGLLTAASFPPPLEPVCRLASARPGPFGCSALRKEASEGGTGPASQLSVFKQTRRLTRHEADPPESARSPAAWLAVLVLCTRTRRNVDQNLSSSLERAFRRARGPRGS